jgi:cell division septation protein DedD
MARSSSGKSVARAAATGGGATYRGQMPVNWYAALVVILLVGIASVAFAKYHYNQTATSVEPTTNTTWHAGLAFDICGTMQPALSASPSSASTGLITTGQGVLQIHPKSSSESGANATLGKFASGYQGLTLTNTILKYPASGVPEYRDGEKCQAGTPDAGMVGQLKARWWVVSTKTTSKGQVEETGGLTTTKAADLRFVNRQLITVGFVPQNVALPKPPSSTILALVQVLSGSQPVATTTTTAPSATTTTTPASTTPTAPTTTTTAPTRTTTKPPSSSTTTTKPPSSTTTTK